MTGTGRARFHPIHTAETAQEKFLRDDKQSET